MLMATDPQINLKDFIWQLVAKDRNVLNSPLFFNGTAQHIQHIFMNHIFPQSDRKKPIGRHGTPSKKVVGIV